jgi:beta-glucosidase
MTFASPDHFFWGAATAAHQVEGNNTQSDFWVMEQTPGGMFKEPSGDACDHYHRYRQDIKLLADLGLNSYRFSIEWARIEPEEGVFSAEAIAHYRDVLLACQENGLTPMVTLHHFTSPRWLIAAGGWQDERTPERFAAYARRVSQELGDLLSYVCTINEANIGGVITLTMNAQDRSRDKGETAAPVGVLEQELATPSMAIQNWSARVANQFGLEPGHFHPFLAIGQEARQVILDAHKLACTAINPAIRVGLTLALPDLQCAEGGEERLREVEQEVYLNYLAVLHHDDFLGVQTYSRSIIGPNGVLPAPAGAERTQMGYEFYPEAVEGTLRRVAQHLDLPLLVSENGLATDDDMRRVEYIRRAVEGLRRCLADGLPVFGYQYWSAFDNFEWMRGFEKRFGLISVDRQTQERTVKESGRFLGELAPIIEKLSREFHVGPQTPPAFLFHTYDDNLVPVEDSLLFAQALAQADIPFEMHLFEHGGHGLALANELTSSRETTMLDTSAEQWFGLATTWLWHLFGKLTPNVERAKTPRAHLGEPPRPSGERFAETGRFTLDTVLSDILDHARARAVVGRFLPDIVNETVPEMARGFALRTILSYAGDAVTETMKEALAQELAHISPEQEVTPK